MKVTVLSENTSDFGLPAEHGLSLYIETFNHRIIFDTGQGDLFSLNAEKLGVDIKKADIALISHGHYDHGGGLGTFLSVNDSAKIYMSKHSFDAYYNGTDKYIGLNKDYYSDRIVFVGEKTEIDDSLVIYTAKDVKNIIDFGISGLNRFDGEFVPDDFRHEIYLVIRENDKRILISGCSHKGIINILESFKPDVFIGGFHFHKTPVGETLANYSGMLDVYDTDYYTCHCTGTEQYMFMKKIMNKRLEYICAGRTFYV